MPTFREVANETTSGLIRRQAAEIERLRADAESLREWIREALHELCDPCDACDFGDSEFLALRATVDNAIGKLSMAIGVGQSQK